MNMFTKLHHHLLIFNTVVTSVILCFSFTLIYFVTNQTAINRPLTGVVSETVREQINRERRAAQASLLQTLIISGLITESGLIVFSYFWLKDVLQPVEHAYTSQKIFIANASHEIKTPLAAIEANLEAADIQDNHWIDNINREIQSLKKLDQQLLTLSRADELDLSGAREEVDVKKLLETIVKSFESRLQSQNLTLSCKFPAKTIKASLVKADFEQILAILLDNAIKYGKSFVIITLKSNHIQVTNDGATIDPQDAERIFERFYQADKAASGTGLGLAIAKTLAHKNKWQLKVNAGKTTAFILEW